MTGRHALKLAPLAANNQASHSKSLSLACEVDTKSQASENTRRSRAPRVPARARPLTSSHRLGEEQRRLRATHTERTHSKRASAQRASTPEHGVAAPPSVTTTDALRSQTPRHCSAHSAHTHLTQAQSQQHEPTAEERKPKWPAQTCRDLAHMHACTPPRTHTGKSAPSPAPPTLELATP